MKIKILSIFVSVLFLIGCGASNIKPINNGDKIGVVLMHGKGSDGRSVKPLEYSLSSAGVQYITPDLSWHRDRIYDKTFQESLLEIQGYVEKLKAKGVKKVFVAGHSLGAVVATGYGRHIGDINGIILLAPGHFTGRWGWKDKFEEDLEQADDMINEEKGSNKANFKDRTSGRRVSRYITANIYKSWFGDGDIEFVDNMKNLKKGVSVLYIAASQDKVRRTKDREYAFDFAPINSKNKWVEIDSSHDDTPAKSGEIVVDWLRKQ